MRNLRERIAYLQGLAKGLELKQDTGEGRILGEVLEILEDMAGELEELAEQQSELEEYVSAVDESLGDLEADYYGEEEYKEDEEKEYIEMDCPDCGEGVYFEAEVLDEDGTVEITCPRCGAVVFTTEAEDEEDEEEEYEEADEKEQVELKD